VTGGASYAFVDVNFVIEIDKIWKVMDFNPGYGLARSPAGSHGLKQAGIRPNLRMTVHASLGWGDSRIARLFDRRVTVLALQTETRHVVLVTERNRLIGALPLPRHPWRPLQLIQSHAEGYYDQPC
jgi:hypothetical protein